MEITAPTAIPQKSSFQAGEKDALLQLIKADQQQPSPKLNFPRSCSPLPTSEENVFFLDKENKQLQLKTSIEFTPISQFSPSPKDVINSVCVDASPRFIYYLLKDGKVRLISKASGKREVLRGERSPFVDFSLVPNVTGTGADRLALLGKGGNVEIYEVDSCSSNSNPSIAATAGPEAECIEIERVCRILLQPEQPFFSQITWHPTDKSILIAHAHQRREVYFICIDELEDKEFNAEGEFTITLSLLSNGSLCQTKGIYKLASAKEGEDVHSVSFSPSGSFIAKISKSSVSVASASDAGQNICEYLITSVHRVFWISEADQEEALILCCDSQICVAEFNNSAVAKAEETCFSTFSFQFAFPSKQPEGTVIKNHYSWDPLYRILFVGNAVRNSIICVAAVRDEDSVAKNIFWKLALLGEYRISHSISCMRLIMDGANEFKRFLCTVYNSGVCSYAIDINCLLEDAAKLRLGAGGPHLKTSRQSSTVSLLSNSTKLSPVVAAAREASIAACYQHECSGNGGNANLGLLKSIQGEFAEMFHKLEADKKIRDSMERERQEQILKTLSTTLSKNLPSLVEYAVKSQLESIVVTKLSSLFKSAVEEALSKATANTSSTLKSAEVEEMRSSVAAIKDSLSRVVQVLEASLAAASGGESSGALGEESASKRASIASSVSVSSAAAPVAKPHPTPVTIQQELDALVESKRIEDAFRRALNVKNISVLLYLLRKFNAETFFSEVIGSNGSFPTSNLLSLCQQLTIELHNDTEIKLAWLQEALLSVDTAEPSVRQYFGQIFAFVSEHLQNFIVGAAGTGNEQSVKLAKILLKLANSINKNIASKV